MTEIIGDLKWLRDNGFNITTAHRDSKHPNVKWKQWQTRFIPDPIFKHWLHDNDEGLYCMITGKISNVVVVDVDSSDVYTEFFEQYENRTIVTETPSGGKHLWFRCKEIPSNSATYNGFPIDIRGEGGECVVPPSISDKGEYIFINKNNGKPMEIDNIFDVLSRIPDRSKAAYSETIKKYNKRLTAAGFDLYKLMGDNGIHDLEKGSHGQYKCECIFHNSVSHGKALELYNTGSYYCHGCKATGDIIDMVKHLRKCSFKDAILYLEAWSSIQSDITFSLNKGNIIPVGNERRFLKFKMNARNEEVFNGLNIPIVVEYLINKFHILVYKYDHIYYYDSLRGIYIKDEGDKIATELILMFSDLRNKQIDNEIIYTIKHTDAVQLHGVESLERFEHENLICFENGVYDIENDKFIDHSWEYFFTSQIPVTYSKNAKCPIIEKFMESTFDNPGDEYEWIGYCMTPSNWLEKMTFYIGPKRTGKSTFLHLLENYFGAEYTATRDPHELTEDKFAVADLFGKSLCISGDIGSDTIKNFNVLKRLVGRDRVTGQFKGETAFSFINTSKLIYSMNDPPIISDKTDAAGDRLRLRWCINSIEEKDPFIKDKMSKPEELSGLANLAIAGLKNLLERGRFNEIDGSGDISYYEEISKKIYTFTEECLTITGRWDDYIYTDNLFDVYILWCHDKGFPQEYHHDSFIANFKNKLMKNGIQKKFINKKGSRVGTAFRGVDFSTYVVDREWWTVEKMCENEL